MSRPQRAGVAALLVTGLMHALLAPSHYRDVPYLGIGFALFAVASVALAVVLDRAPSRRAWDAAVVMCAAGVATLLVSRTVGLPGHAHDIGYWRDPAAAVCLVSELLVVAVGRRRRPVRPRMLVAVGMLGAFVASAPLAVAGPRGAHEHAHAHAHPGGGLHDSHLAAEGLQLVAAPTGAPPPGGACATTATVRRYDVVAVAVDLPLNRWGDHDPLGRSFVLAADVDRARADEVSYANARRGSGPVPVSTGLQADLLQPLTLRVLPGECLRLSVRDQVPGEPVSLDLHGAALRVRSTGRAALPGEPSAVASPGATVDYEWAVPSGESEGTHYFRSAPPDAALGRQQTSHGLYGAVIVEPGHARWLNPTTGQSLTSGWAAVVVAPGRKAFREFALYYAEVGDETYQPLDRHGVPLPQAESLSGAYRPGGRVINYRSEPFFDRLALTQERSGRVDDSLSYSSYTYGDPATPMMRSYLGDPVTQRVIHAGSEVAHVHHVHGGGTRWRRQPGVGPTGATTGLDKHPPLTPGPSERTDSQTIGPSETFDVEDECGAGGCQQSVGDFMFHCHIAHHYFAGMWGLWRVYNTLQDEPHSTDSLAPLLPLPDRTDAVRAGVDSAHLIGGPVPTAAALPGWLAKTLPPPGRPQGYDATVWDWTLRGDVALGEPEDTARWADFASTDPGARRPVLFDPVTGKPAYPMLRPHLGRRPPFAPWHSPAPYLDATAGPDLPAPGANGPASICPTGTHPRALPVTALELPVPLNAKTRLLDPDGKILVLKSQEAAVRADPDLRRPLTVRANAGEDCLDVTLTNGMTDATDPHGFSKVSMHVHFVQFDVQGSDGVDGGFNYEQTVRPYAATGRRLAAAAPVGAAVLPLASTPAVGTLLGVGMDRPDGFEVVQVAAVRAGAVVLSRPLRRSHAAGEAVSSEFVRYRWYPDVEVGTAFFHDHVNAILGQPHGLYGGLVVEPPGSSYSDPVTGRPLENGPLADVHTSKPASVDVKGSFRELVTYLGDDTPLTSVGRDTGGTLGLRAEPLASRPDPQAPFRGDVTTPTVSAYVGDPVVFRTLVGASNEVHTFHLDGHGFRVEPWSTTSPLVSTVPVGISERYDVSVRAGGPRRQAGDYVFGSGRLGKLDAGSWGLLRVRPGPATSVLKALPGVSPPAPLPVCPAKSPLVTADVSAVTVALPMLHGGSGLAFVHTGAQRLPLRPLLVHMRSGDCLRVTLTNQTDRPVSLHADLLAQAASSSAAGHNADAATRPGQRGSYLLYADPSLGATVAQIRDGVDPVRTLRLGLYGAVVVDPAGSQRTDDADGVSAVVRPRSAAAYRDFTVFLQDGDASIGTHRMPYTKDVDGVAAVSYGSAASGSEVAAPVLRAFVGDPVQLHVVVPASEQTQVVTVDGHTWPLEPGRPGTTHVSAATVGGLQSLTLRLDGGAGGRRGVPGDYRYGNARLPYDVAGMWGILRVQPHTSRLVLAALPTARAGSRPVAHLGLFLLGWLLLVGVVIPGVVAVRRRRGAAAET
ncbi:MAG: hypothetical protein QOJ79_138 [Actinomycetota bacterium]|jgi:FtsP/CotA-like multicopper oxidase with cupredoxin domain|nr:hypothetical protein [Actinomycetota bacterium]